MSLLYHITWKWHNLQFIAPNKLHTDAILKTLFFFFLLLSFSARAVSLVLNAHDSRSEGCFFLIRLSTDLNISLRVAFTEFFFFFYISLIWPFDPLPAGRRWLVVGGSLLSLGHRGCSRWTVSTSAGPQCRCCLSLKICWHLSCSAPIKCQGFSSLVEPFKWLETLKLRSVPERT